MSIKLKESQLLAAHLIASGVKSSEILNQLNIRPETLCRWKQEPEFIKVVNDTTEIILNEIIDTHKNILILSQKIILDALQDESLDLVRKANIALRFIGLMKGKDDLSDKSNKRLSDYKLDRLFPKLDN
jgi:hypothetical protein